MSPTVAPFGTWKSPIDAEIFGTGTINLAEVAVNESNGKIYCAEGRFAEGGRSCIVEYSPNGASRDVLSSTYSAAGLVHEYGGASFIVRQSDGKLIFTDAKTKLVFVLDVDKNEALPIVEEDPKVRFADFNAHPFDQNWIIAVKEDHHNHPDVVNSLVAIDIIEKKVHTIQSGADFYCFPQFSPDGKKLCWKQWNNPDMQFTGNKLYVGDWSAPAVRNPVLIAGKTGKDPESISQPRWGQDGTLFFVSDRSGYYQLYVMEPGSEFKHISLRGLEDAEFAGPEWWLGSATYAQMTSDTLLASYTRDGVCHLIIVDIRSSSFKELACAINDISFNAVERVSSTSAAVIGCTATAPKSLFHVHVSGSATKMKLLKTSLSVDIDPENYSIPQPIRFPRTRDPEGGEAYMNFLPPKNLDFKAPSGALPPLIILMHGGPTYQTGCGLMLRDQYWTSRGYAVAQVNYTGSSGYGRAYRSAIWAKWGISETADAASCVDFLGKQKLIDTSRVGITGGSAGGYATMQGLCTYPDVYAAGVSHAGVSDLQTLRGQIIKLEAHYIDRLCFHPDAEEEERERVIRERSPLYHTDKIKAPLLLLQGADDPIVPPGQATLMEKRIRERGGDVKIIIFASESHQLRDGKNMKEAAEQTEQWWKRTLLKDVGGS